MSRTPLYEEVAEAIGRQIVEGVYAPGERLPSIRELGRRLGVSVNTVSAAYAHLENRALVQARPQAGHFVRARPPEPVVRPPDGADHPATPEEARAAIARTLEDPGLLMPGRGMPNPRLLPAAKLAAMLGEQCRRHPEEAVTYAAAAGHRRLRAEIAKRSVDCGCALSPGDIVVTSGCTEAMTLALRTICRPGDLVAVGAPVHVSILGLLRSLGLRPVEIPSDPRAGINLAVLDFAIRHEPPAAVLVIPTFNNPLGYAMDDGSRRALVALLARHGIPLIEDDVWGDLAFAPTRPPALKAYDRDGLVVLCSSFSKTLAPGFRVGWTAPGRFREQLERSKALHDIAASTPPQLAIAEFLAGGGYDRHLRHLRRIHAHQTARMRECVAAAFPAGTRVTDPQGGFLLWVELPEGIDALPLHAEGLRRRIGIAPGLLFSEGDGHANAFRLDAAYWSPEVERGLTALGAYARSLAPQRT
jgi:DNA-binding transcriptional MocR family regulator